MRKFYKSQLEEKKGKIVWMASYPKSGNTWFRALLSGLFYGALDINKMNTDGIFSNRFLFDGIADFDGRLFDEEEVKEQQGVIFSHHIKFSKRLEFTKVHDAYSINRIGQAIFPKDISHKVIYLVRNPLDVVASFSNHLNQPIDRTIQHMNNESGYLARQPNGLNINNQFPQLMYSWSGHVNSWINQKNIPVEIVRYEDLKKAPHKTFSRVVASIGIKAKRKDISNAIDISKFDKLQKMEKNKGFREKNAESKIFFRKGKSGAWKNELTSEQAKSIIKKHKKTMVKLGYAIPKLK